jgi:O-antigen/teichoic acid export membrane protein
MASRETIECDGRPAPSLDSRLRRGGVWVVGGRTLGIATTVLVGVLLPRLADPGEYAAFMLASSVMIFAGGLAMFGLNGAMVRFLAERMGQRDLSGAARALRIGSRMSVVSTVVVALAVAAFLVCGGLRWFKLPYDPVVVILICAGLALLGIQQLSAESLRGLHELRLASVLSGGQYGGPLTNILFIGVLWFAVRVDDDGKLSLQQMLCVFVVALLITAPLAVVSLRRMARRSFGTDAMHDRGVSAREEVRTLLPVCTPLMLMCGLSFAATQADLWIAGLLCRPDDVALYAVARRLVVMIAMPLQMVNLTVMSSIPELYFQGRITELQRLLRFAAATAAAPTLACLAVILWKPAWILGVVFGAYYSQAAGLLLLLAIGQLALALAGSCALTLSMTGHQRVALRISMTSAAVLAIGGPLATHWFGLPGLAAAVALSTSTECGLQWIATRSLLGVWTHFSPRAAIRDWQARRQADSPTISIAIQTREPAVAATEPSLPGLGA